jgi:hypothetical protein
MGASVTVAGEGMGLTIGGHESARERAGVRGTVLMVRSHWVERERAASGAWHRQVGPTCQRAQGRA